MCSFARDSLLTEWTYKLQVLPTVLQNTWSRVALAAFVAVTCFLSTGLLWPAAAILSSILTSIVRGYLEKHTWQQCPQAADEASAECLKGAHSQTCDPCNTQSNAVGECIADRDSIAFAPVAGNATGSSNSETCVEIGKWSSSKTELNDQHSDEGETTSVCSVNAICEESDSSTESHTHLDTMDQREIVYREQPALLYDTMDLGDAGGNRDSQPLWDKATKNPIRLADILMGPGHVEKSVSLPSSCRSSFEQARCLELHSSHAKFTQLCLAPSRREPVKILLPVRQEQLSNPLHGVASTSRSGDLYPFRVSNASNACDKGAQETSFTEASVLSFERTTNRKTQQKHKSIRGATQTVTSQFDEDWYCPVCFDLQFRANLQCRMCGLAREYGVTELKDLNADSFLEGHAVSKYAAERFRRLAPALQQAVISGGSLLRARDPTAVLSSRMKRAEALASIAPSRKSTPIKLGFDRKRQ